MVKKEPDGRKSVTPVKSESSSAGGGVLPDKKDPCETATTIKTEGEFGGGHFLPQDSLFFSSRLQCDKMQTALLRVVRPRKCRT